MREVIPEGGGWTGEGKRRGRKQTNRDCRSKTTVTTVCGRWFYVSCPSVTELFQKLPYSLTNNLCNMATVQEEIIVKTEATLLGVSTGVVSAQ